MAKRKKNSTPSLLELESRGGDTAIGGFSFQDGILLSYIPLWLAQDGFTMMIREAIGDTEAKFFVPAHKGFKVEFIEVKSESLTPSKFWKEIKRFQKVDAGSPGTYRSFTIVSAGLSAKLQPLINGLQRIRNPDAFYDDGSGVKCNSFNDYVEIVQKYKKTEEDAQFLFDKVQIQDKSNIPELYPEALFNQSLIKHLPGYQNLPYNILTSVYKNAAKLITNRLNKPITRLELESALRAEIDFDSLPPPGPVILHTAIDETNDSETEGLRFDWAKFFGGESRTFPPPAEWNEELIGTLRTTKDWIVKYRSVIRVKLTGNRRLSSSLAIGSVFSAVAGFKIDLEYRDGKIWATDAYQNSETQGYSIHHDFADGLGDDLVVSIGILRDIANDVEGSLNQHKLEESPKLHIKGTKAIVSPEQANLVVKVVKDLIAKTLTDTKCKKIHLFPAVPAFFALFLGHRLNATAPVQCYEWVSSGRYVPTCCLFSNDT